jgi:hypothetical protein
MALLNASASKLVSSVFDSLYTSTMRVSQSLIANKYRNSRLSVL